MAQILDFNARLQAKRDEEFAKRTVLSEEEVRAAMVAEAKEEVRKSVERANAQVVAKVLGEEVTRGTLSEAFDTVCDPKNWKMPIDKTIAFDGSDRAHREIALIEEAIKFFSGSVPKMRFGRDEVRITAPGYYNTIGA